MSKQMKRAGVSARRRPFATGGALLILIGALVLALTLIPAGAAGSAKKTFHVSVAPGSAPGGASVTFTMTISNDATSPNQLGSANVTPPAGFTITQACSGATVSPCTPLPSGSSTSFPANPLMLRSLSIAPGHSLTFAIQATTPCTDPGGLQWVVAAKQSNDFSSTPGNDFSNSPLSVAQSIGASSCKLAFANQPADTVVKTAVSDAKWGSVKAPAVGNPIKIEVLSGNTVVAGTGTVTMQAVGAGCSFTNSTTNVTFSQDGYAYFSNLKMANVVGSPGCQLQAINSSAGFANSDLTDPNDQPFFVDPVVLYFASAPADTAVKTPITTSTWGSVYSPQQGGAVNVGAQVVSGRDSSKLPLTGNGTIAPSGSVSVSDVGCAFTGDSMSTVAFSGVYAAFSNLKPAAVATGCTLSANTSTAGYSDSGASGAFNADPVELFFLNQPTDSVVNTPVRDVKYGGTVNAGNPINVGVRVRSQTGNSTLQLTGSGTVAPAGTVSVQAGGTAGCSFTNSSTASNVGFTSGVASFSNLKMANVVTGCNLQAVSSSAGYANSSTSTSFNVDQFGVYCADPNNCILPNSSDNQKYPNSNGVQTAGAQTITLDYNNSTGGGIPPDAVCYAEIQQDYVDSQGNRPSGTEVLIGPASGFGGTPSTVITHTVNKHWVQLFPNNGNPFIDICMGAQRIDLTGLYTGGVPGPVACTPDQNGGHDPFGQGWITKSGARAVCASDGNYYGIVGSYQQTIPSTDPQITSWAGSNGDRVFTISLGTPASGQAWIWDLNCRP
jgi:hypothetical protein